MSAAIAPNPADHQAQLGMPARPWWIGYIRQLHLDIPLAVESGGTGKADRLMLSDLAAYKETISTSAAEITANEGTVYRLIGSGSRRVNLPSGSGVKSGAEVEIFIESPTITDVTITPAESENLISQGGAVDYVFTGLGKSVRMIRVGQSQWNVIEPDVSLTAADIAETSALKIMTATERTKLAGIAEGANNYTHPATHPQSMIEGLAAALAGKAAAADLTTHTSSTSNPHGVTKAQVGLANCDNTADTAKPVSTAQAAAIAARIDKWQYSYFPPGSTVNPGVVGRLYAFAVTGTIVMPLASTCAQGDQIGAIVVAGGATITITRSGSDQFVTPTGLAASYTLQGIGSSIVLVRVTTTAWAALGAPDSLINAKAAGALLTEGTPTGPTDTGTKGMARFDADYFYVCTATNTWVRFAKDGSWT